MKKPLLIFICVSLLTVFIILIVKKQNNTEGMPITQKELRALELSYLRAAISQENILDYAHLEVPSLENINIKSENGTSYLALRTYPGQPLKNNGIRAEISIDYPHKEGDVVRYSWQFRIPENFQSDTPQNRWWIMGQWHDQPDITKGETWDTYNSTSPPIGFGYGIIDGKDMLSFIYGRDQKPIGLIPLTRDVWHTIIVDIIWSQNENGRAKVFFDDAINPILETTGQNMLNSYQHYFKIGSYRHKDISVDSTINLRDIIIKTVNQ